MGGPTTAVWTELKGSSRARQNSLWVPLSVVASGGWQRPSVFVAKRWPRRLERATREAESNRSSGVLFKLKIAPTVGVETRTFLPWAATGGHGQKADFVTDAKLIETRRGTGAGPRIRRCGAGIDHFKRRADPPLYPNTPGAVDHHRNLAGCFRSAAINPPVISSGFSGGIM